MLTTVLVLTLQVTGGDYVVYSDALYSWLGWILMQNNRVVAYASGMLKVHEVKYLVHDLSYQQCFCIETLEALFVWREFQDQE